MPISLRAAALRAVLERALDEPVRVVTLHGSTRLHAPAPGPGTASWSAALAALRSADRWGSTDAGGTPEIWAEITEVSQ